MATKKPRDAKAPSEEEKQQIEAENPPHESNGRETITKAEAVRRAMAAGVDTPAEGAAYVKEHFGIEMDAKTFSLNRSQQRAREARQSGDEPKRRTAPAHAVIPTDLGSDIKLTKQLIEQAGGVEQFKQQVATIGQLVTKYGREGVESLADALG